MKISDLHQKNPLQNVPQSQSTPPPERPSKAGEMEAKPLSGDRVEFSARSKEMQKVYEVLRSTPDIRAERVAELKKQIEEGRYHVERDALAEKIIKESLLDLL
ncbi:MAG: flagellar biosynthesis anti-sigma factor FlgM [Desulfobacterota bacterium]|nr:flagellar biosynthesis anti-sigma factor FlgM [Thermodesulfobacteriota bacterium]